MLSFSDDIPFIESERRDFLDLLYGALSFVVLLAFLDWLEAI